MRRFALVAVFGTSVAWAMASAVGGCSSDTPATPEKDGGKKAFDTTPNDQGTTTSSSSSASSASSSSSGGGATDGGATKDGGGTTVALVSNPKKVSCLTKEC